MSSENVKKKLLCIPGDFLCGIMDANPGSGTYVKNNQIFASIRGILNLEKTKEPCEIPLVVSVLQVKAIRPRPEIGSIVCCQIEVANCFRPGDIILARVISLGEPEYYYLSTLEPELGVVLGMSTDGRRLYPMSWNKMSSSNINSTETIEPRKVAKLRPEFIAECEDNVQIESS